VVDVPACGTNALSGHLVGRTIESRCLRVRAGSAIGVGRVAQAEPNQAQSSSNKQADATDTIMRRPAVILQASSPSRPISPKTRSRVPSLNSFTPPHCPLKQRLFNFSTDASTGAAGVFSREKVTTRESLSFVSFCFDDTKPSWASVIRRQQLPRSPARQSVAAPTRHRTAVCSTDRVVV
jgi:hypothetical protein